MIILLILVLGLQDKIGNFQVGKEFDALRIHLSLGDSPVDLFSGDSVEDKIEKFLHIGESERRVEFKEQTKNS